MGDGHCTLPSPVPKPLHGDLLYYGVCMVAALPCGAFGLTGWHGAFAFFKQDRQVYYSPTLPTSTYLPFSFHV